jgi:septal ring factor EnvC (AmiA/AmiB activator)
MGLTASEKTATAYRFSLNLKPNSEEKFVVKEEYVYDQSYAISSSTPDQILIFLRNPNLSPAGKQALEKIQLLKSQIAESDRRLRTTEAQSASLEKDQERLRENIRSLNSVSGQAQQVQRYASDLSTRETKIVELRDQAQAERQKKGGLESELNGFLATVTF